MGNLRFMKTFVAQPANKWVTAATASTALTTGQIGAYVVDNYGITGANTGTTPDPATVKRIKVVQNVGDSLYGRVHTQIIDLDRVKSWRAFKATAATTQTTYIGWDEATNDGTKDIVAVCGKELVVPIHIYEHKMMRWYGTSGFHRNIVVDTGCCPDCGSPCTAADKTYIATQIAAQINNVLANTVDYLPMNELNVYLVATVVTNGGAGTTLSPLYVGVKIVTRVVNEDLLQASLNTCNPQKWWELQNYDFTVGNVLDGLCSGTLLPVTTTVIQNPGSGWAAMVASLEAESQGFDRVRSPVTEWPYSDHNGYVIYATAGVKYDIFILDFDYEHRINTGTSSFIKEPYEMIIAVPTTTGDVIETLFNTWLAGKFTAMNLN